MIWVILGGVVAGLALVGLLAAIVAKMPPSNDSARHDTSGSDWLWTGGDSGGCHHGGHGGDGGGH